MRCYRPLAVLCALLSLAFFAKQGRAQSSASAPAYTSDSRFLAAVEEGKQFSRRHQFPFAGDAFKKANKIAGGQCLECLSGLYSAEMGEGSFKDAVKTAETSEQVTQGQAGGN